MKQLIFIAGLVFAVGATAAEPAKKEEAKPAASTPQLKKDPCVTKECADAAKAKKKADAEAKKKTDAEAKKNNAKKAEPAKK